MNDLILLESGIFSDLSLEISDSEDVVHMNVHKCILYSRSPYFRKILDGGFREQNEDNITLWVENANFTKIIIESFYGKPLPLFDGWKEKLMLYFMQQYFQVENIDFPKINIAPVEYDEFMQTLDHFNYPIGCIKYIKKYLPKDYDLSKLPKCVLEKLLNLCEKYLYVWINDKINIMPDNTNKLNLIEKHNNHHGFIFYPDIKKFIMFIGSGFYIYNFSENELIGEFNFDIIVPRRLKYQSKKYILLIQHNNLHLYDIEKKNEIIIKKCKIKQVSSRWCNKYYKWFQDDYKYMVLELKDKIIHIYNIHSGDEIMSIGCEDEILDVMYTDKKKEFIYRNNVTKLIEIIDIESKNYKITLPNQNENNKVIICYSECNNYILAYDFNNNKIKVWSNNNYELVNIIEIDDDPVYIFKSTKYGDIIICYENYAKVWNIISGLVVKTIHDTNIKSIDCIDGKDYELVQKINDILKN
ncbi:BTB/POZ domain-containing protein [Acanthamoeba polyphaga moumouvirus]|uniref:BTB/POZ domain-containing protein n=1 Tax=Acanthamoeba polyphaga moumouvirus TaxID=1269028 RepID=L7RCL6_9VIRU|nr:BTB/POZ domain-containing protein [Acanthamoeba polyphaga moumouvirus]AGC02349.1 BTB/POZ domain-containing protein [Acanthamoeba polyphaga moumouvirus]